MQKETVENGRIMPSCMAFLNNAHTCNRMAEYSSAETSTSSNFSCRSHSAYTSEVESDAEANRVKLAWAHKWSLCQIGPGVTKCDKILCGDVDRAARNNVNKSRSYAA